MPVLSYPPQIGDTMHVHCRTFIGYAASLGAPLVRFIADTLAGDATLISSPPHIGLDVCLKHLQNTHRCTYRLPS